MAVWDLLVGLLLFFVKKNTDTDTKNHKCFRLNKVRPTINHCCVLCFGGSNTTYNSGLGFVYGLNTHPYYLPIPDLWSSLPYHHCSHDASLEQERRVIQKHCPLHCRQCIAKTHINTWAIHCVYKRRDDYVRLLVDGHEKTVGNSLRISTLIKGITMFNIDSQWSFDLGWSHQNERCPEIILF